MPWNHAAIYGSNSPLPRDLKDCVRAWFLYFWHNPEYRQYFRWASTRSDDIDQGSLSMVLYQPSLNASINMSARSIACFLLAVSVTFGLFVGWLNMDNLAPSEYESEYESYDDDELDDLDDAMSPAEVWYEDYDWGGYNEGPPPCA
jgi:hypothetical protein